MPTFRPNRWRNSARVASGAARTNSRIRTSCGAKDPVAFCRGLSRRTQDALTEDFYATAGAFSPAWQSAHTRSRKSIEYARIGGSESGSPSYPNPSRRPTPFPELH
jgi:hypothetical protein